MGGDGPLLIVVRVVEPAWITESNVRLTGAVPVSMLEGSTTTLIPTGVFPKLKARLTKIQAAPASPESEGPPTMAVRASPEIAVDKPCAAKLPADPLPTSLSPCCVQTPVVHSSGILVQLPLRVKTHTAPRAVSSFRAHPR